MDKVQFMHEGLDEKKLERIWKRSIMPYLKEYYFDQESDALDWNWDSETMQRIRADADDG